MKPYTVFGKISRKIAIDLSINTARMAQGIGYTTMSLSNTQHGTTPLSKRMAEEFIHQYRESLSKQDIEAIRAEVKKVKTPSAKIVVAKRCPKHLAEVLELIKERLDTLTDEQIEHIKKVMV